jgi:hypothetical protein
MNTKADTLAQVNATDGERDARAMAELIIAIAENEAEMGVPTDTAYTALEEIYYRFRLRAGFADLAKDAQKARKYLRLTAWDEGWEFDKEEWDLP